VERHLPVLAEEVVRLLIGPDSERIVDATVGSGGHAEALLEAMGGRGLLIGLDRDARALERARHHLSRFGDRVSLREANFRHLAETVLSLAPEGVDGVLMDLGVSSEQLDDPAAGFSYRAAGPLSLTMEPGRKPDAADLVNEADPEELARVLREYGDVRRAGGVARAIVRGRPYATTLDLVAVLERVGQGRPDDLSKVFQALRIAVNDEFGALTAGLAALESVLRPGGRAIVIAYHSGEDRLVKRFFSPVTIGKPLPWLSGESAAPRWELLVRGAVQPTAAEVAANRRSRSARLRAARRIAA
jgi:16S rRNA (cytosine1402-N4)-methyltransferase